MTGTVGRQPSEVDLHLHSRASDGDETPERLAARCVAAGLRIAALTDHNTMAGVAAFRTAAGEALVTVPGCEVSALWRGKEAHCLAYWVGEDDQEFAGRIGRVHDAELRWWRDWVEVVHRAGVLLEWPEVERHVGAGRVAAPGDYLRLLLAAAGDDPRFRDYHDDVGRLAEEWCRPGLPLHRPDPWWPDLADAVSWIVDAGGVAVLAHPARLIEDAGADAEAALRRFRDLGLAGVEAWTTWHTPEECARLAGLCDRLGLVATAGSDFHGTRVKSWALGPGLVPVAPENAPAVVDALHARRPASSRAGGGR